MKRRLLVCLAICSCFTLMAWSQTAKRAVAQIAENHLTPKAKEKIKELIGDKSLADISIWADEAVTDPKYKNTALWHFVNLPLGITSKNKFENFISAQSNENISTAIYNLYYEIIDSKNRFKDERKDLTKAQKIIDLELLISLVADVHQPLNFSSYEDDGGKNISLIFDGKKTNLYAFWNTGLLEKQKLNYHQLAALYDTTALEKMDILDEAINHRYDWFFETYELNNKLHKDIKKNTRLNNTDYEHYIPIVDQQIKKGGIRLAALLNDLFMQDSTAILHYRDGMRMPFAAQKFDLVAIEDINSHMGNNVKVCSKVYSINKLTDSTWVYIGAAYPHHQLTLLLKGKAMMIADILLNKDICLSGVLVNDRGRPEIIGNKLYVKSNNTEMFGSKEEIKIEISP